MQRVQTLLGGAAASWPACAQDRGRFYRIGVLEMSPAASNGANFDLLIGLSHRPRDGSVVRIHRSLDKDIPFRRAIERVGTSHPGLSARQLSLNSLGRVVWKAGTAISPGDRS